jgi:hypothetical protein
MHADHVGARLASLQAERVQLLQSAQACARVLQAPVTLTAQEALERFNEAQGFLDHIEALDSEALQLRQSLPSEERTMNTQLEDAAPVGTLHAVGSPCRLPSHRLTAEIVRTFQQTGARQNFASFDSLRDLARIRSIVNSGGVQPVVGEVSADVIASDVRPANLLLDVPPIEPRGGAKIHVNVIGYGANRAGLKAAIVPEGSPKPQSDLTVTPTELAWQKVAHWACATDEELDDIPALRSVIDQELLIGLELKVDALIVLAAITAGATAYVPPAGSSIIDNAAIALATLAATGERAPKAFVNPYDLALALTAKADGDGQYLQYPPALLASILPSPTIPQNKLLALAPRGVQIYERESDTILIGLKNDDLVRNQRTIVAEWRGNAAVVIPTLVLYGDATGV